MEPPGLSCPFCDAADPERVGQWGGQMITAQWRCRACGSYFEAIRDSFDEPSRPAAADASIDAK
jgi:transposase-like protein